MRHHIVRIALALTASLSSTTAAQNLDRGRVTALVDSIVREMQTIDDDVSKHVSDLPMVRGPVTLRQLLHQTTGIPRSRGFRRVVIWRPHRSTLADPVSGCSLG
jgi:hypothetical protein